MVLVPQDWTDLTGPSDTEDSELGRGLLRYFYRQARWSGYPKASVSAATRDFPAALTRLRRRVRTLYEDAGFWTLFLAVGLLRWSPVQRVSGQSGPEVWESPLLLVPVNLEQESPVDPFLLTLREDEEVQFNLALRTYLQDVEKVVLPEADLEDLFGTLEALELAAEERGWQVERLCWLNLFSFPKMAIYRDLKDNEERIICHPVVQALAGIPQPDLGIPIAIDRNAIDDRPSRDIATVLPADSSQLEAVLEARAGKTFWVHGPPGTGKSQTIVNIIADALGRGKTVLFVSEKRAALEVVLRRLRQVGLEPFCLDLHHFKTRRGQVVQSIADELQRGWAPPSTPAPEVLGAFDLRRNALARYVRAVHTVRSPLNRTAYWAIGRASRLPILHVHQEIALDAAALTEARRAEIIHLAEQLASVADLAREGHAFPWCGLLQRPFTEQARAELLERARHLDSATRTLLDTLDEVCSGLGLRRPVTTEDAREFCSLLEKFNRLPPLPSAWTVTKDVHSWIDKGRDALAALLEFHELKRQLSTKFNVESLESNTESQLSYDRLRDLQARLSDLTSFLSSTDVLEQPVPIVLDYRPLIQELSLALERALRCADALRASLGLGPCLTLRDVERTVCLARPLAQGRRLEPHWLERGVSPANFERAREFVTQLAKCHDLRNSLLQEWSEDLFSLEAATAWDIWQRRHRSPFRLFSPSYRRVIRVLLRASRGRKPSKDKVFHTLQTLRDLRVLETSLEKLQQQPDLTQFLGRYYDGLQTRTGETFEALELAEGIRDAFQTGLPQKVRRVLSGEVDADEKQLELAGALVEAWHELAGASDELRLSIHSLPGSAEPPHTLVERLRRLEEALARLTAHWEFLLSLFPAAAPTLAQLSDVVEDLARCLAARERFRSLAESLRHAWGWVPAEDPMEWERALSALDVWAGITARVDGLESVPTPLAEAGLNQPARPSPARLAQVLKEWDDAFREVRALFQHPFPLVAGQKSFPAATFEELCQQLEAMQDRVDEVQRYLDFQRFRDALASHLSAPAVDAILSVTDLPPEELPRAVERLVLSRWLDWVFDTDPALRDFRWEHHQRYLEEFRELDQELSKWASATTVQALSDKRANLVQSRREVQILLRESRKRRRHRSIRWVIREAFHAMLEVKPCWLMSPLSVSHFLLPDHRFDVVIFDEASQVRPEDAISAIYRAEDQVIICGDPKQLPPTAFFQARILDAVSDDDKQDDEDEAPYRPEGESILDDLDGALPSVFLRWHYRSKDERLIAFSNYHIYGGALITFPTPRVPGRDTGIEYRYLSNAVYERSGRRVNQAEVDEVCRLVRDHLERSGTGRTLGVVTMNEPQKDAVLDELERQSLEDPSLRVLWDEAKWPGGEAFFVKNLEAVQGDERDVIIISTTYGQGPDGRLTMQFGPLTQAGGERRLNVLITRAREKVIVVTSLRPEDLRLSENSEQAGLRLLQAYLRFARDGTLPPEAVHEDEQRGSFDSDFEASVADVLRSWGYEVQPQYGVGPYRIDLAVWDPRDPGRVQVAVECDGATYHRLPTVRERDRIRQEWLERQGWRVVRVWSLDWWYQRKRAEERLRREVEDALRKARSEHRSSRNARRLQTERSAEHQLSLNPTPIDPTPDLRTRLLREKRVELYVPPRSFLDAHRERDAYAGTPRIADPQNNTTVRRPEEIDVRELEDLLRVSAEALEPCLVEDLLRDVAGLLGFRRLGRRIRAPLEQALNNLVSQGRLRIDSRNTVHTR